MRKIREILRFKADAGLTDQRMAGLIEAARSMVRKSLGCCRQAGVG